MQPRNSFARHLPRPRRSGRAAFVRCAAALAVAAACVATTMAAAAAKNVAILQGLDKVTARISTFEAPVDEKVRFGTLDIVVRHCQKTPPEEPPETTVFLEIEDVKRGEDPVLRFRGWMFASSPALSALEHPIYDVWVIGCKNASSSARARSR